MHLLLRWDFKDALHPSVKIQYLLAPVFSLLRRPQSLYRGRELKMRLFHQTIPQTRRRFQHHLIGLNDPDNYTHAFALHDNLYGLSGNSTDKGSSNSDNYTFSFGLQDNLHDLTPTVAASTGHPVTSRHLPRPLSSDSFGEAATAGGSSSRLHARGPGVKAGDHDRAPVTAKLRAPVIDIIEAGEGWTREEEIRRPVQGATPRTRAAKGKGKVVQQHYSVAEGSNARRQA
jgi:hypothetical protein